jgi:hypothetical protein
MVRLGDAIHISRIATVYRMVVQLATKKPDNLRNRFASITPFRLASGTAMICGTCFPVMSESI